MSGKEHFEMGKKREEMKRAEWWKRSRETSGRSWASRPPKLSHNAQSQQELTRSEQVSDARAGHKWMKKRKKKEEQDGSRTKKKKGKIFSKSRFDAVNPFRSQAAACCLVFLLWRRKRSESSYNITSNLSDIHRYTQTHARTHTDCSSSKIFRESKWVHRKAWRSDWV